LRSELGCNVSFRLKGSSPFAIPDFERPLSFFDRTETGSFSINLDVNLSPKKKWSVSEWDWDSQWDHQYFHRPGEMRFSDSSKGFRWDARLLTNPSTSSPLKLECRTPFYHRFRYPWGLFPGLIPHLYLIHPLLEWMIWQQGGLLLHAAAVEKNGRCVLIAGRGGVHKSSFVLALMQRGWRVYGDDLILLADGQVHPFPTFAGQLDFLYRKRDHEWMGTWDHISLAAHLLMPGAVDRARKSLPIPNPKPITSINLIWTGTSRNFPSMPEEKKTLGQGWNQEDLARSLTANHRLESLTYVGFRHDKEAFLKAWTYFEKATHPPPGSDLYMQRLLPYLKNTNWKTLQVSEIWNPLEVENLLL
jgi:hypothetical protein